jgi:hypothetical protein
MQSISYPFEFIRESGLKLFVEIIDFILSLLFELDWVLGTYSNVFSLLILVGQVLLGVMVLLLCVINVHF